MQTTTQVPMSILDFRTRVESKRTDEHQYTLLYAKGFDIIFHGYTASPDAFNELVNNFMPQNTTYTYSTYTDDLLDHRIILYDFRWMHDDGQWRQLLASCKVADIPQVIQQSA